MKQQISAIERLQSLPPVFRGADLTIRFQWTSKTASQYLYLWKNRGLVEGLGGHSDVFVNLMVNGNPNWEKALLTAMPSVVLIGIEALRQAGWVTQVPYRPSVAVDAGGPVFSTERYEIAQRDQDWFKMCSAGVVHEQSDTLPRLSPAWALADLLREPGWGECGLHPTDIEWSEVTPQDEAEWRIASEAMGLPEPKLMSMSEDSRSHGQDVFSM